MEIVKKTFVKYGKCQYELVDLLANRVTDDQIGKHSRSYASISTIKACAAS